MLLHCENKKIYRIAVMGIYHESNTFCDHVTTLDQFKNGRWLVGKELLNSFTGAHHELGGIFETLQEAQAEIVPVFYAETTPGGILTKKTGEALVDHLLTELKSCLHLHACILVPHGAAVSESQRDFDGFWMAAVRNVVGRTIPIAATIDPHANVSRLMVDSVDILIPYATNPHVDQKQTGNKATSLLLQFLEKRIHPKLHLVKAPVPIGMSKQETSMVPCRQLYNFISTFTTAEGILHIGVALGFPYADVEEMGTSFIIITNTSLESGKAIGERILGYFIKHRASFVDDYETADVQLERLPNLPKPVLLLDTGDNVGAGGSGNSTFLLPALKQYPGKFFICIVDEKAVLICLQKNTGDVLDLSFGLNPADNRPYNNLVTIQSFHSGYFTETEPRHGGQMSYNMGATVIVKTSDGNTVMLISRRTPPFSLNQLASCNVVPSEYDYIVAKGANAPIAAYGLVCKSSIKLFTPGTTQIEASKFNYKYYKSSGSHSSL